MLVGMASRNIVGRCGLPDRQSRLIQIDEDLGTYAGPFLPQLHW